VYNVALPLLRATQPDKPPFRIVELPRIPAVEGTDAGRAAPGDSRLVRA
jgi:hypothetical protein